MKKLVHTAAGRVIRFPALAAALFILVGAVAVRAAEPSPADLVNIRDVAPNVVVDMRYATEDNFLHRTLYAKNECYLRRAVAEKLAIAQAYLEKRGLGVKCWDCFRPHRVQYEMWKIVPDPRYVADPRKGSKHNRGIAVDVTLVDAAGRELEMPTGFDDFSPRAAAAYSNLPAHRKDNREMLRRAMKHAGFRGIRTEWWHYDGASSKAYPIVPDGQADALLTE